MHERNLIKRCLIIPQKAACFQELIGINQSMMISFVKKHDIMKDINKLIKSCH